MLQNWSLTCILFQLLEGFFAVSWPYKCSIFLCQEVQWSCYLQEIAYEPAVEVAKPYKCLYILYPLWRGPIFNGFNLCRVHFDAILADYQPQIFGLDDMELAFINISLYAKFSEFSKHTAHVLFVLLQISIIDQDIVQVRGTKPI